MTNPPFQIKLWGVRGSLPISGPAFRKFGGSTMCIEMRCGDHVLIFDAGSGILPAGRALVAEGQRDLSLFFTHCHYDHISGLPFFLPLYSAQSDIKVWSGHMAGKMTTLDMLTQFLRAPFFPIGLDVCSARLSTADFQPGDVLTPHPGIVIRTALLAHTGNAVGYRVEWGGRAAAVITDTEHVPGTLDPGVLGLMDNADLVLYDSTFGDEEFEKYQGYGHSTWQQAVRLAKASGTKKIGFIHHSIQRTDAELTQIEKRAKSLFAGAFCGRELQVIDV